MISTQNVVNFLKTYFALFVLSNERYYYIKDSSSSTISFTSLTTKTELLKCLQYFALNVKNVQKCDINAKCCKFLKTYFALFVPSDEKFYYKKRQFKIFDVI